VARRGRPPRPGWIAALAQGLPTVTVTRAERTIVVAQRATGAEGARTVLANRNCEAGVLTNVFFGPVAGYVETRFDDTVLLEPDRGGAGPDRRLGGRRDGRAVRRARRVRPPGCLEEVDDAEARPVELRQGRTTIEGTRFFLDRGTDVADFDGPVTLTGRRPTPTAGPAGGDRRIHDLRRRAERATLIGDVVVTSGERTSTADALDLDEAAGVAILTGSPAVSRRGSDEVRGSTLRYDLETDEVVAIGVGVRHLRAGRLSAASRAAPAPPRVSPL
jgi:lipopolysaccharide export system protein LptA